MAWWDRILLRIRPADSFLAVCLFAGIGFCVELRGNSTLHKHFEEVSNHRVRSLESLQVINQAQTAISAVERTLCIGNLQEKTVNDQYDSIREAFERVDRAWKIYQSLPQTNEETALWREYVIAWKEWETDEKDFLRLSRAYQKRRDARLYVELVDRALKRNAESFEKTEVLLGRIQEVNRRLATRVQEAGEKAFRQLQVVILACLLLGLAASVVTAVTLTRVRHPKLSVVSVSGRSPTTRPRTRG
ncbi:MAG: MCP four helix bundle domain-containing protein [Deltaproteobacteria bacterium]|nr:MCP four helix bundle domain-containing protein [Deltaproteobacteria bacterium]